MFSRLSHVRYNCAALNRCPLRKRLALIKRAASSQCRYGCPAEEDLQHVLFHCPRVRVQRDSLMKACDDFGYGKTLRNRFTRKHLQFPVETLLVNFTDPSNFPIYYPEQGTNRIKKKVRRPLPQSR